VTEAPALGRPALYRHRNLVERFFNKLKHCRRIATRYEKPRDFLAAILIANPPLDTL
jgi:transposase